MAMKNDTKVCRVCKEEKAVREFYKDHARCKPCYLIEFRPRSRESFKKRKQRNPDRIRESSRKSWVKSKYGLAWVDYLKLEERCGGRCEVCGIKADSELSVDHCHHTGVVRGLLCRNCNLGLGNFNDDPAVMLKAISYITHFQTATA